MFSSYLNRSRFCKGEMCGWMIEGAMIKLSVRKVRVEGSKLSVRPPVLLSGKSIYEVGRAGREGRCKF